MYIIDITIMEHCIHSFNRIHQPFYSETLANENATRLAVHADKAVILVLH